MLVGPDVSRRTLFYLVSSAHRAMRRRSMNETAKPQKRRVDQPSVNVQETRGRMRIRGVHSTADPDFWGTFWRQDFSGGTAAKMMLLEQREGALSTAQPELKRGEHTGFKVCGLRSVLNLVARHARMYTGLHPTQLLVRPARSASFILVPAHAVALRNLRRACRAALEAVGPIAMRILVHALGKTHAMPRGWL